MAGKRRITLWIAGAAALAAGLGAGILVSAADEREGCESFRFDREAWLESSRGDDKGTEEQTEIAERLVECRLLLGRGSAEVRRMLGPPDEQYRRKRTTWLYELGPERSMFSIDSEFLKITFARRGRVDRAFTFAG